MFFFYQIIILLLLILSPLILIFRFLNNKEHKKRFIEKFCLINKKKSRGNLIWIHAASVGEFMSIIPLIQKLEKNNKINHILITTSTLSSSKIFAKYKFKKTFHQFFPIDFFHFSKKFIKHWNPKIAIFIDSEIWPSMYKEISKNSIPLLLMNARISKRSFQRWKLFHVFTKNIFEKIRIAYPSNTETHNYLKKLNVKRIKKIGNLKFSDIKIQKKEKFLTSFLKRLDKRLIWCASSTHPNEEKFIAQTHLALKKKFENLLTIIIPRHIQRVNEIKDEIKTLGLNVVTRTSNKNIQNETDIYLVDTYGETKKFFNISKIAFIGGSLIKHGGQNPIEPARYKLNIIHGPHVDNFKDIYRFFSEKKIAYKIKDLSQLIDCTERLLKKKKNKKINLKKIGNSILKKSIIEINDILKNEI